MSKCAIISGIYGQDGLLLTEYLLKLNYKIFGIVNNLKQGFPELSGVQIIKADISNSIDMKKVFELVNPDEFYHLAAYHHSSEFNSKDRVWSDMLRVNFLATQNILDTLLEITPTCRFLFAGSSQMYTATTHPTIIDELTPFKPSTYYGFTKVASAHLINFYREKKGLWGLTLILFNHESILRRPEFLSRKVTKSAAEHALKIKPENSKLILKDLSTHVDWSAASDFVRAMQLSLQNSTPKEYVLASGVSRSVGELVNTAYLAAGLNSNSYVFASESNLVPINSYLVGNPSRAKKELGWNAEKSFNQLIFEMVDHDIQTLK